MKTSTRSTKWHHDKHYTKILKIICTFWINKRPYARYFCDVTYGTSETCETEQSKNRAARAYKIHDYFRWFALRPLKIRDWWWLTVASTVVGRGSFIGFSEHRCGGGRRWVYRWCGNAWLAHRAHGRSWSVLVIVVIHTVSDTGSGGCPPEVVMAGAVLAVLVGAGSGCRACMSQMWESRFFRSWNKWHFGYVWIFSFCRPPFSSILHSFHIPFRFLSLSCALSLFQFSSTFSLTLAFSPLLLYLSHNCSLASKL